MVGYGVDREPGSARLMLDLTGDAAYRVFALRSPSRVVIDLTDVAAHWSAGHVDLDRD